MAKRRGLTLKHTRAKKLVGRFDNSPIESTAPLGAARTRVKPKRFDMPVSEWNRPQSYRRASRKYGRKV